MKRVPSFRRSIARADALLARYAASPALLDALHALAVLDGAGPDAGPPSLTELALAHLRAERGRGRIRPPLALGELFDLRLAHYAPAQTRSIGALACARRFLCGRLGADRPVESIREEEISKALSSYGDPQSFNSLFRRLRLAFNWAVRNRLIERSPLGRIEARRVGWREPAFFPPDRVERILRAAEAHPGSLAAAVGMQLALGFFAGVRTVEIARARWEDLDLSGGVLRIPRPKGFTSGHRPRLVELEPCAVAWLRRWRDWTAAATGARPSGPIVANPRRLTLWKALRLAPAGDSWGNDAAHNVMRHTYATMHVGAFRNAAATALNLGHADGTGLLERHYRGLVPKSVAEAYWRILPSDAFPPPPEPEPGRGFRSDLAKRRSRRDGRSG